MEIVCICSQFILQKLFFMELHTIAELCNLNIQRYVCISLMSENDCQLVSGSCLTVLINCTLLNSNLIIISISICNANTCTTSVLKYHYNISPSEMEIPVTICFKIILWIITPISGILAMPAELGCVLQNNLLNRGRFDCSLCFPIIIIFMVDVIFIYPLGYCDINQKMFY